MADLKPVYRFLRVLEYVGSQERLVEARERRSVKGTHHAGKDLTIFEGILGDAASPATQQVQLEICRMIVDAADNKLDDATPEFLVGWDAACQRLCKFLDFNPESDNG